MVYNSVGVSMFCSKATAPSDFRRPRAGGGLRNRYGSRYGAVGGIRDDHHGGEDGRASAGVVPPGV